MATLFGRRLETMPLRSADGTSGFTVSVTPNNKVKQLVFSMKDIDVRLPRPGLLALLEFVYIVAVRVNAKFTVTPLEGEDDITYDKTGKIITQMQVELGKGGVIRPYLHTQGAEVALIDSTHANADEEPNIAAEIIGNAGGAQVRERQWDIPITSLGFEDCEDFAQTAALFKGGNVRVDGFVEDVLDGDSDGALLSDVEVTCSLVYFTSPYCIVGNPIQIQRCLSTADDTQSPEFSDVGKPQGIESGALDNVAGITDLLAEGNPTGLGLEGNGGGAASSYEGATINFDALNIEDHRNPAEFMRRIRHVARKAFGGGNVLGGTVPHDGAGYPFSYSAIVNLILNSQSLFFAFLYAGTGFKSSACLPWKPGDAMVIDMQNMAGGAPSGNWVLRVYAILRWTDAFAWEVARMMDPSVSPATHMMVLRGAGGDIDPTKENPLGKIQTMFLPRKFIPRGA